MEDSKNPQHPQSEEQILYLPIQADSDSMESYTQCHLFAEAHSSVLSTISLVESPLEEVLQEVLVLEQALHQSHQSVLTSTTAAAEV